MEAEQKMKKAITACMISFIAATIIGLVCIFLPVAMGKEGVIKETLKDLCITIAGIDFFLMGIWVLRKKDTKKLAGIAIIIFAVMAVVAGCWGVSSGVRGLLHDPIEVKNVTYEVWSKSSSHHGIRRVQYYMRVSDPVGVPRITIDKSTYDYLSVSHQNVSVTYYPYVNIADEIIYESAALQEE